MYVCVSVSFNVISCSLSASQLVWLDTVAYNTGRFKCGQISVFLGYKELSLIYVLFVISRDCFY